MSSLQNGKKQATRSATLKPIAVSYTHLQAELMERLHNIIERAEIVEMIGIDICDDADGGVELQERIDIFTRFANNVRTFADSAVAVDERQLAADDGARVTSGFNQDLREHAGRRRFAVRAGNRNGVCKLLRQKAEHHGTLQRRNTLCTRRNKLRVILLCSRREVYKRQLVGNNAVIIEVTDNR